jgi:hypothetical protein
MLSSRKELLKYADIELKKIQKLVAESWWDRAQSWMDRNEPPGWWNRGEWKKFFKDSFRVKDIQSKHIREEEVRELFPFVESFFMRLKKPGTIAYVSGKLPNNEFVKGVVEKYLSPKNRDRVFEKIEKLKKTNRSNYDWFIREIFMEKTFMIHHFYSMDVEDILDYLITTNRRPKKFTGRDYTVLEIAKSYLRYRDRDRLTFAI